MARRFPVIWVPDGKSKECGFRTRRLMRKHQRLTKAKDFAAVRREGKSWSHRLLVLIARPNDLDVSRVGFSVGTRVGKAVVRNTVKRRLREATRLSSVQKGWDLLIIARRDASSADFHSLRDQVTTLLSRAKVLETPSRYPCSSDKVG